MAPSPSCKGQELDATVTAQSRLQTPEQFRNIVLKSSTGGAIVRIRDVARVELGAQSYTTVSRMNGKPAAGLAIQLAPGANALKTADAVKAKAQELVSTFPPGMKLAFPIDNTTFIRISIRDVIKTLIEATLLVVVVMFIFLQHWRATLIPAIAVPVVLLGTFGVLAACGYSINTLTLFALVLAIGLLVADDAIVVVEKCRARDARRGLAAQGSHPEIHARDHRRVDRHRAGAVRRAAADGILRRFHRCDLPSVLHHHRLGDAAVRSPSR